MENYVAKHDKLMRLLQMRIESATPEHAVVTMPLTPDHRNGHGFAHGGAIFSLADVAFGAAANAGKLTGVVSLSTAIEFLRPAKPAPCAPKPLPYAAARTSRAMTSWSMTVMDLSLPAAWLPATRLTLPCPHSRANSVFAEEWGFVENVIFHINAPSLPCAKKTADFCGLRT